MNTTIIASIIALLSGFFAGTNFINLDEPINPIVTNEDITTDNIQPSDFVSLRPNLTTLPIETLSESETSGLLLMREEEKLARDVYQTLYEKWGLQIFANIAQSEQTHTEAIHDLLNKYDLTDPVTNDTVGVFTNQNLQELYNSLVTKGNLSAVEALKVGATIEDLDINDLERLIEETDNQDIILVYTNLTRGSRNHLRSFTKQLSARGEVYEAKYISSDEYQSIITNPQESGNSQAGGNKNGRGWGQRN